MSEYLSNKFRWLSLAAMLGVVGIHSRTLSWTPGVVDWADELQMSIIDWFMFAVPVFFVVSGYFLISSYRKRGWGGLLINKAKSLYLPSIYWCLLAEIIILPQEIYLHEYPSLTCLLQVPLLTLNGLHISFHFWYVQALLVAFLTAPLWYAVSIRKRIWLVVWPALFVGFETLGWPMIRFGWWNFGYLGTSVAFFLLGAGLVNFDFVRCRASRRSAVIFLGISVGGFLMSRYVFDRSGLLFKLSMIAAFWFAYDLIDSIVGIRKYPASLMCLFFIYCCHTIVIKYSSGLIRISLGTSPAVKMLAYFVNISTFGFDILIANWLRGRLPMVYGVLAGGR